MSSLEKIKKAPTITGQFKYATYKILNEDYNEIKNKPKINGVELSGDKSLDDLNVQEKGNYAKVSEIPTKISDLVDDAPIPETLYALGADYAEYFEWEDGNPNNEDRTCLFVSIVDGTRKIRKSTIGDDVLGIVSLDASIIGNARFKDNKKYSAIGMTGVVKVKDNGLCKEGDYVIPGDNGIAIPSTNRAGYKVTARSDGELIEVLLAHDSEMISRMKDEIDALKSENTQQTTEIETLKSENTRHTTEIKELKSENTQQTTEIEGLKSENAQQTTEIEILKSENAMLRSQIPSATVVGEAVNLQDSSNMPCQIVPLGASIQEGTPSIGSESPIESVGDSGSIEIYTCNKNLFNKNTMKKIAGYSGYIDNTGYLQYNSDNRIAYIICAKNKDYTVSSRYLRGIAYLNEVPRMGLTSTNFKVQNTTTITLNSGENSYMAIWYYNISSILTEQEILDSMQIETSTTATDYVEHQSQAKILDIQQPLRSIGNVKDRFVKADGIWYEEHKIGRIERYNGETISTNYMSSTGELSTGATVDYILATPRLIPCTTEQVKVLESFSTYKNVTNILTDSIGELEVFYYKDLSTYIYKAIDGQVNQAVEEEY